MTTPAKNAASGLPSRLVIVVLALCGGFAPFAIDAYLPGLPAIADEFGVPASTAQLTLTGFLVSMGLAQLVIGPLSDQRGRRGLLLLGLTGATAASVIAALAPSIEVLIGARVLQGVFGAAGVVLSRAIVADLGHGVGIARAFSALMAVQSIAPVVAPAVGGLLIPSLGWRAVFVFLALLGAGTTLAAFTFVHESLPDEHRHAAGVREVLAGMRELLTSPRYLARMIMFVTAFAIMFAYVAGSPFVMQRLNGLSDVQFSIMFTINSATLVAANLLNGRIVERIPVLSWVRTVGIAIVAAVAWIAVAVFALGAPAWALMVGFFVLVACNGFLFPNLAALTLAASGRRNGTGSALMGAGQFTLAAIVAPLTGIGDGTTAVPMATLMVVAATCLLLALLGVLRTATPEELTQTR